MTAPLVLLARPEVWQDKPDDIPDLLNDIQDCAPEVVVLDLPRGLASPKRIDYLDHITSRIRVYGYVVDWREIRVDGKKRVIVIAQRKDRGRRPEFCSDLGQLIIANY